MVGLNTSFAGALVPEGGRKGGVGHDLLAVMADGALPAAEDRDGVAVVATAAVAIVWRTLSVKLSCSTIMASVDGKFWRRRPTRRTCTVWRPSAPADTWPTSTTLLCALVK